MYRRTEVKSEVQVVEWKKNVPLFAVVALYLDGLGLPRPPLTETF